MWVLDGNYICGYSIDENSEDCEQIMLGKPNDAPSGYQYRLRADNLEWELVELPPMPEYDELSAEEALDIITGGAE